MRVVELNEITAEDSDSAARADQMDPAGEKELIAALFDTNAVRAVTEFLRAKGINERSVGAIMLAALRVGYRLARPPANHGPVN